jgi:PAS domain S-box-containing protein
MKTSNAPGGDDNNDYRQVVENCGEAILLSEPQGGVVAANPAACRLFKRSEAEICEIGRAGLVDPSDPRLPTALAEREKNGAFEGILRFQRADGSVFPGEISSTVYRDAKGRVRTSMLIRDITERQKLQAAITESLRERDTLLSNLPGMAYRCRNDRDWTMEVVSNGCLALTGYAAADLIGNTRIAYGQLIHADDREGVWKTIQDALQAHSPYQITYRIQAADGALRWVWEQGQGVFSASGQLLALEGFIADVTKRRQAEEALRDSEHVLRSMINAITESAFIINTDGIVLELNETAGQRLGRKPAELIGRNLYECLPADIRESRRAFAEQVIRDRSAVQFEDERWGRQILNSIYPVLDAGGRVTRLAIFGYDITDRKHMESEKVELEAKNQKLQKAESLARMAGAIAHHFNNQLQVVMGNLELAMEKPPEDSDPLKGLREAMSAARQAAAISGLMLTYLGQAAGAQKPVRLSDLCRQYLPALRSILPKGVTLETNLPTPGPLIVANARQIQQLLVNLTTNAGEAMENRRGAIQLNLSVCWPNEFPATPPFPADWRPQERGYACLEVADTGSGIAPELMDKLFDPFFSTKFTGRGLGLPVVLGIARAHDGCVIVASQPRRGSVFRVFLPALPEA